MGQILSTGWSLEQSDALRSHIAAGLSYAQAAEAINTQFGTSYTRSSAIGRANRIGLAAPIKPKAPPTPRVRKVAVRIVAANGNSNAMRVVRTVTFEQAKLRCVEIVPRNLTLTELEPNDCRYPYGDETITFCGHPKLAGSSYCASHHHLCWIAPAPRKVTAPWREVAA